MENLTYDKDGTTRLYEHWAGEEWTAKIIPFGALVEYIPNEETRPDNVPHKWGARAVPGVFAGYELGECGKWEKKYLVWDLRDFESVSLASDAYAKNLKLSAPNRVFTVRAPDKDAFEFPLRAEYVRKNYTYDGVRLLLLEQEG